MPVSTSDLCCPMLGTDSATGDPITCVSTACACWNNLASECLWLQGLLGLAAESRGRTLGKLGRPNRADGDMD